MHCLYFLNPGCSSSKLLFVLKWPHFAVTSFIKLFFPRQSWCPSVVIPPVSLPVSVSCPFRTLNLPTPLPLLPSLVFPVDYKLAPLLKQVTLYMSSVFFNLWASHVALLVKNPPANAGHTRDMGSLPGLGRFPGVGNGTPVQYSCLENYIGRGTWQSMDLVTVHGTSKSQTQLSMHTWARVHTHTFFSSQLGIGSTMLYFKSSAHMCDMTAFLQVASIGSFL